METAELGRVTTEALIENLEDLWEVTRGLRMPSAARSVLVAEALIDTGATNLSLPSALIASLGLRKVGERPINTSRGPATAGRYEPVRLTILSRDCVVEVLEVPDGVPTLIGQIPLEYLDLVVDPKNRRLIGNPAHGGEFVTDMY